MSNKYSYLLLNPFIEGDSVDTLVTSKNPFNAGKKLYKHISDFFTNRVDNFYMTIQNVETKDLTHFLIKEKEGKQNDEVNFDLIKINDNFPPEFEKKIISTIESANKQYGGKHHKHRDSDSSDSDSSTSSDDDDYKYRNLPINRFVYYYLPYYKLKIVGLSPLDISRLFVPTFGFPINPSIEIRLDLYGFNV